MNEMVSIIVPVYNVEQYIDKCLKSIISSTYTNLEIILIDDGSTDSSGNICDRYAELDKRCKVYHKKNGGLPDARNYGLDRVNGKYIMFVDSDDWIDNDCVQKCVDEFNKDEKLDCVIFPYIREFAKKSVKTFVLGTSNKKYTGNDVKEKIHRRFWGLLDSALNSPLTLDQLNMAWGKMYKADLIGNIRFTSVEIIGSSEDNWFNAQVFANATTVVYRADIFYYYNKENESSIVHSYRPNLTETKNNLHKFLLNYAYDNNYDNKYISALKNREILTLLDYVRNIAGSKLNIIDKYNKLNILLQKKRSLYTKSFLSKLTFKWKLFHYMCYLNLTLCVMILCYVGEIGKKYIRR